MPKSIKICIDDKHYEQLLNIIEGKKISDEVRANIVECGRERLKKSRAFYKGRLTSDKIKSTFTKNLTRKTAKSHVNRSSSRTKSTSRTKQ